VQRQFSMPAEFEKCVKEKGRVRRIVGPSKRFDLGNGQYRNVCFKNKKMFMGHIKSKKKKI